MARAIGATAISRVMRSAAMRPSTSSRSKRRCSRTVAPASAAASRLSRPRMWVGGVATWKRSSGPRPSAPTQWAVAWPIERWEWRTALGSPVVPELNTRMASPVSGEAVATGRSRLWPAASRAAAGSSRSVTAPTPSLSASSAAPDPSATPWRGSVSRRAWSTSTAFQAGLSSTAAAPSLLAPWTAATNSTRFEVMTATRSPGRTPRATRWRANALARPSRSANDQLRSPSLTASRSPKRSAACSRPRCIRLAIGNIVLRR